ncbi:MAG TPA: head-tail connector protein [Ferruginibacter sp.]|nr:head-tail connector protein [Ferruginibacter sp.]
MFTEPVTVAEAKNFCQIDVDDDDDLVEMLITACRVECEQLTNIGFIRRTIIASINNANGSGYLPFGPHGDIESVTDSDDVDVDYEATNSSFKQLLTPCSDRLIVTVDAGYETLPSHLKMALLECIHYRYDERKSRETQYPPVYLDTIKQYSRVW